MDNEALLNQRRSIARSFVLIFLLGWGLLLLQARPADAEPPATAANITPTAWPTPIAFTAAPIRIEWFSHCNPADDQLGLYAATDGACTPGRTAPLNWLQSQLLAAGALAPGEYIERAARPALPACGAAVFDAASQHVGWLCLDGQGVYRTDTTGLGLSTRWQLQGDGSWARVR